MIKNLPTNAGDIRDVGLIPELGRFPGGGHGNPLQYSCLENLRDRGAWRAAEPMDSQSRTRLSNARAHTHTHKHGVTESAAATATGPQSRVSGLTLVARLQELASPGNAFSFDGYHHLSLPPDGCSNKMR